MKEKLRPWKKISDLSDREFKEIPTVECFFSFEPTAKNNYLLEFKLVGKTEDYPFREREKVEESHMLIAFPGKSLMEIRNAKQLKGRFPLRIQFGATSNNNTLGYFGRFEVILNENRKMISALIPNVVMEFILKNYTSMLSYLWWSHDSTPLDIMNAFELMRERERSKKL